MGMSRLKRQLLLHHADLVCLQGLDAEGVDGTVLAETLSEEGYGFACARRDDGLEANSIFWDRTRFEVVTAPEECGAAIAVNLRPFEDPDVTIRALCLRPAIPTIQNDFAGLRNIFSGPELQLVCADLTLLGGAEASSVVEELASIRCTRGSRSRAHRSLRGTLVIEPDSDAMGTKRPQQAPLARCSPLSQHVSHRCAFRTHRGLSCYNVARGLATAVSGVPNADCGSIQLPQRLLPTRLFGRIGSKGLEYNSHLRRDFSGGPFKFWHSPT